ncbi:response regulator transcription factor [Elizabethkingia meningoseptica]|uniref:response regulator transcription factor n=1 Tax=Elizabethkingia meningoseptica TaxID=238 RepID=UPI0020125371|nr:helix-turn-helix transcriptional regulator [Elizabethkingia meningoseptica]MCL1676067.1 helix-turn-helix transcriptional regulator [Elizabethkingia meningoseptica]MCL1684777.1 helix-turn-helix transcriptional regulator [Elizabethkingia meningoseptica]
MSVMNTLNEELLQQNFGHENNPDAQLVSGQRIAGVYAETENAIAVLSDLVNNRSYIYYGNIAASLDLIDHHYTEIPTIWEKDILDRIHPEDLAEKYRMELYFFHFLKSIPLHKRKDYHVSSALRMKNGKGAYVSVWHRIFYINSTANGSIGLVLCLYSFSLQPGLQNAYEGLIVNTITGEIIKTSKQESNILSEREKEILTFIKNGKPSKEIAAELSISLHTVNRHRQNILEKLHVSNSFEACYKAECLGWIS